jgi:hypothetical protein
MWLKTTAFMGAALMAPYTLFVLYKEATHAHSHDEHVAYPHMKVRRKAFPWVSWCPPQPQLPPPPPPLARGLAPLSAHPLHTARTHRQAANQCDFFDIKCHRDAASGAAASAHH